MCETKLVRTTEDRRTASEPPDNPERSGTSSPEPSERQEDGGETQPALRFAERLDEKEWENVRPEIKRLYIDEGKPLKEVMATLKSTHGITATMKQYKSRMKRWKFFKNISVDESKFFEMIRSERERSGRTPRSVRIDGRPIEVRRVEKHLRRKGMRAPIHTLSPSTEAASDAEKIPAPTTGLVMRQRLEARRPLPHARPALALQSPQRSEERWTSKLPPGAESLVHFYGIIRAKAAALVIQESRHQEAAVHQFQISNSKVGLLEPFMRLPETSLCPPFLYICNYISSFPTAFLLDRLQSMAREVVAQCEAVRETRYAHLHKTLKIIIDSKSQDELHRYISTCLDRAIVFKFKPCFPDFPSPADIEEAIKTCDKKLGRRQEGDIGADAATAMVAPQQSSKGLAPLLPRGVDPHQGDDDKREQDEKIYAVVLEQLRLGDLRGAQSLLRHAADRTRDQTDIDKPGYLYGVESYLLAKINERLGDKATAERYIERSFRSSFLSDGGAFGWDEIRFLFG